MMAFLSPPPPPPPLPPHLLPAVGGASPHPSISQPIIPTRRRRSPPAFTFPNPFDPKKRTVLFRSIEVIGRRELPEHVIQTHFNPLLHRRIVMQTVHDTLAKVNDWLIRHEYVCSQIVIAKIPSFIQGQLVLVCVEPSLSALRLIAVDKDGKPDPDGAITTRPGTICNAIGMRIGDVFVWRSSGFARLMALGLFEYANAEVKVISNSNVELHLRLKERPSGRVEPGAGIASDGRVYGDISIVDNNFMGRAQRLRVEWQKRLDVNRSAGGIAFEDQRLGARIPISFRMRAYRDCHSNRSIPAGLISRATGADREGPGANIAEPNMPLRYEKDRDGVLFDIGYRPTGSYTLFNFTPMFEHIHPNGRDPNGSSSLQTILQTGFTHATRLPIDLPRAGHMVRIEQFLGTPLRTAFDPFYKFVARGSQYIRAGPRASAMAAFTAGMGTDNLPWHEQQSLGGQKSVRGYQYGELGRYKSYATGRLELRVPLAFSNVEEDQGTTAPEEKPNSQDNGNTKAGGEPKASAVKANADKEKSGKERKESADSGATDSAADASADGKQGSSLNLIPVGGLLGRLPPLVGVLFGDVAAADTGSPEILGASYGLGLRVGGVIAVEWTSTADGRRSRVHFGLVDHSF